jgi:hypothetical protein
VFICGDPASWSLCCPSHRSCRPAEAEATLGNPQDSPGTSYRYWYPYRYSTCVHTVTAIRLRRAVVGVVPRYSLPLLPLLLRPSTRLYYCQVYESMYVPHVTPSLLGANSIQTPKENPTLVGEPTGGCYRLYRPNATGVSCITCFIHHPGRPVGDVCVCVCICKPKSPGFVHVTTTDLLLLPPVAPPHR